MLISRARDQPSWSTLEQRRRYRAPDLVESECRHRPSGASSVPGSFGRGVGGKDAGYQPRLRAHCVDVQFALTVPTVADRIAQQVVKTRMEPELEPVFHADSYGYRPGKSALDAVGQARERCWRYDWVIDLDIKGFFDNLDHNLLLRAVRKHAPEPWIVLYIERWLQAPMQEDGQLIPREKGTPQGGVASPLLANLFLHYALDRWLTVNYPHVPLERYADDGAPRRRGEESVM